MAVRLVNPRPLPDEPPSADSMELYFRAACTTASMKRQSVAMAFPMKDQSFLLTALGKSAKAENGKTTVLNADFLPSFVNLEEDGASEEQKLSAQYLLKRGLARDRVAATALVVAADMEKHTVTLTPEERAKATRRPALLRQRYAEAEQQLLEAAASPTYSASEANAFKRLAASAVSQDPHIDASRMGRTCASLRMQILSRTRAENELLCQSWMDQLHGKKPALEGMGQSMQVRADSDAMAGSETFVAFHFASPEHALLVACGSDDGAVALGYDASKTFPNDAKIVDDPEFRRNHFKRRTPAAVTWHDAQGRVKQLGDIARFEDQPLRPNLMWVHDAAELINRLHANSKENDYLWLETSLW